MTNCDWEKAGQTGRRDEGSEGGTTGTPDAAGNESRSEALIRAAGTHREA